MSKSSNFVKIDISNAQAAANNGDIVIAAWINTDKDAMEMKHQVMLP